VASPAVAAAYTGLTGARQWFDRSLPKNSSTSPDLIFHFLELEFLHCNLNFGQNKSCRGKEELQLSFWAKVDLRLESR
jgi:hypothetical protein